MPLSKLKDSFLDGTSSTYLEELEERYRSNPKSVDKSWASFFHSMGARGARVCPGGPPPLPPAAAVAAPVLLRLIGRLWAGCRAAEQAGVGFGQFVGGREGRTAHQSSQTGPAAHCSFVAPADSLWGGRHATHFSAAQCSSWAVYAHRLGSAIQRRRQARRAGASGSSWTKAVDRRFDRLPAH